MARQMRGWVLMGAIAAGLAPGAAPAANWAEALFSESAHDFGPVPRGAVVRHRFVLTNRLDEPITVANLRASCGCTTGQATASQVAPGQSAAIEAVMDTRNFAGKKATTLFVTLITARGQEAEVRLGVSSTILSDVVLNPGTIDFGTVVRGQAVKKTLTIDRIGAPDWRVVRMVSACKAIDAGLVETSRSADAVSYTLTVTLKADAPAGVLRDEIRVLTNEPGSPGLPILVTGTVRGDLTATPSVLALGKVAAGGTAQGRFLVRASQPFAVTAVDGAGDGFALAADGPERKPVHILTVTYRPEANSTRGDLRRTFRVLTDLPGEPPLELTTTLHAAP